ncbi:MAG: hypothetical protein ACFHX7_23825 [Pseudomonadota bacterium]
MTDLKQTGLDAVDKFITTWNSRDPVLWASSLNFPHVRPAPRGPVQIAETAEDYIARVDYNRVIATGWDHSEWDYRQVLHTSPRKIHVVGQWCRYNKAGENILTNPVVYIVTRMADKWGIQSRFSADFAGDEDTSGMESRCFKHIESFVSTVNARNREASAELINYPHYAIDPGLVTATPSAADFSLPAGGITIDALVALQTGKRSMNAAMDFSLDGKAYQAVINLSDDNGHLGIQAWSLLDPAETEED